MGAVAPDARVAPEREWKFRLRLRQAAAVGPAPPKAKKRGVPRGTPRSSGQRPYFIITIFLVAVRSSVTNW